jgi:hypothetical protein
MESKARSPIGYRTTDVRFEPVTNIQTKKADLFAHSKRNHTGSTFMLCMVPLSSQPQFSLPCSKKPQLYKLVLGIYNLQVSILFFVHTNEPVIKLSQYGKFLGTSIADFFILQSYFEFARPTPEKNKIETVNGTVCK